MWPNNMTDLILNCEHAECQSLSISDGFPESRKYLWKTLDLVFGGCPLNSECKFHFKLHPLKKLFALRGTLYFKT